MINPTNKIIRVYRIINNLNTKIYIGSTNRKLVIRFKQHLYDANHLNNKLYNYMNELGLNNFFIELISIYNTQYPLYYTQLEINKYNHKQLLNTKVNIITDMKKYEILTKDDILFTVEYLNLEKKVSF